MLHQQGTKKVFGVLYEYAVCYHRHATPTSFKDKRTAGVAGIPPSIRGQRPHSRHLLLLPILPLGKTTSEQRGSLSPSSRSRRRRACFRLATCDIHLFGLFNFVRGRCGRRGRRRRLGAVHSIARPYRTGSTRKAASTALTNCATLPRHRG